MDNAEMKRMKWMEADGPAMNGVRHPEMGREYPNTDRILVLSLVIFFAVWVPDSVLLHLSTGFLGFIPGYVRVVLFIAFEVSAGVLAGLSHHALFGQKRTEYALLSKGIFARVRHPLYLSILLAYTGFFFGSLSLLSLVPLACYLPLFNRMASYEERDLVRIFGAAYEEYRRKVPKWIPGAGTRGG